MLICTIFTGCSGSANVNETSSGTTAKTTTTTTTTATTTENLSTTFKESATNTIYPALKIDSNGIYDYKLSEYTTYYDNTNSTRTVNIQNAVAKLNNLVIPSGSTFSFNQTVGKRTVLAGYQAAKVVVGDEFVDGLGGGICQVSSTIFQAALRANLQITVRACHSLEISYVPLGGDATVQWNSQDFQFKNNTDANIRLKVSANGGTLKCTVYADKDIEVGDLKVNITKNDSNYVLTRSVNGSINYTTYSKYQKPKPKTTAEKDKTTKKGETTKKN